MIPIGPYYKPSVTFQIIFWSRFFDFIEAEQKINQIFIFLHNFNALLNSVYFLLSFKLSLFCSHAIQFKFAPISKSCQLFFLFSCWNVLERAAHVHVAELLGTLFIMAVAVQKDQIKIEDRQKKDRKTKEQQRKEKKQLTRLWDWCKFKLNSMWAKKR